MKCNKSQSAAIIHKDGPALVLAGPGSGKTFTITQRTKYLISNYHIKEENILVVTFTRAAALEMKERFLKMIDEETCKVTFGTFHSVFFTIIKYAYNYSSANVFPEDEKRKLIARLLDIYRVEDEDTEELISNIISEISRVKGDNISIDNYYAKCLATEVFINIYKDYNKYLSQKNLIDFDDMLLICHELLTARNDILKQWQNKYKYILIDEFQDINRIQYEIVKLLAKPDNNIFAVGDDDQSIYGFRGARPELMKKFASDYKGMPEIILDVNYRSTDEIISAAAKLIANNNTRFNKQIIGNRGSGMPVNLKLFNNLKEENDSIIREITMYVNKGGDFKDVAILYRTNMDARSLIEKAIEYNIPFVAKDVIPNIYDHFIMSHLRAYIDIALGSRKRSDFLVIINKPKRYISRDCLDTTEISFERLRALYDDKEWMMDRIDKLQDDLRMLRDMNPFAAITYIRRAIGYDDYIREYAEYKKINEEDLFDVLSQIQESAREFNDYEEWFEHIEEYSRIIKEENSKRYNDGSLDCVTFSTMHSSKGLEYDIVYIIDANEGITPHKKSVLDNDIEEERRMFYVAMTRARRVLNIYSTRQRFNKKQEISRFVKEILEEK